MTWTVDELVDRDVHICQSSLVDMLFAKEIFDWGDITNSRPLMSEVDLRHSFATDWKVYEAACDLTFETFAGYLDKRLSPEKHFLDSEENLREEYPNEFDDYEEIMRARVDIDFYDIETFAEYLEKSVNVSPDELEENTEIFEWWVVSDRLEYWLKKFGQPILENDYGTWWGRTTTGQSIKGDDVICQIVKALNE